MIFIEQDNGVTMYLKQISTMIISLALLAIWGGSGHAADRLYFAPLVEHSPTPRVILSWGALEGEIPSELTGFRLYRTENGGELGLIAEIDNRVQDVPVINQVISGDPVISRRDRLVANLEDIRQSEFPDGAEVTATNFSPFLYSLIEPTSASYNPLQRMLLGRSHYSVAAVMGQAFADEGPFNPGSLYGYVLTGITSGGETLPLGRSAEIDPTVIDILPAPSGLQQVYVGECSDYRKNLDDLRIYMSWNLPTTPAQIGQNIVTFGYDIFWSETPISGLDLNLAVPEELYRVNNKPIVVPGEPAAEGADSYLARDGGENHKTGPTWQRGQNYYYYIAAIDITGRYSDVSDPVEFFVADRQPPPSPWRLHAEESSQVTGSSAEPEMSLVWDQVNPENYIRYYGVDRAVCSGDATTVCTAPSQADCADIGKVRCVDMDVDHYLVFRFDSPEGASTWGQDSDSDHWPDALETEEGKCDPEIHPPDDPPELVATIDQSDNSWHRTLNSRHTQVVYPDPAIGPENFETVYYYRVKAVDINGNQSPLSPPIRGVIHDRTQPTVQATLENLDCDRFIAAVDQSTTYYQGGDLLNVQDNSGQARTFVLRKICGEYNPGLIGTNYTFTFPTEIVAYGHMQNGSVLHLSPTDLLDPFGCSDEGCAGYDNYFFSFFDENSHLMTNSPAFTMDDLCTSFSGTVTINPTCLWQPADSPGQVVRESVRVCVDLAGGQSARIYHRISGEMSPFASMEYLPDPENDDNTCIELNDLGALEASDHCLGVRVFSENHVGSAMYYFNCQEMVKGGGVPPPPPLVEGVVSTGESSAPSFKISWSSPLERQPVFILKLQGGSRSYSQTLFPTSQDAMGQYSHTQTLDPATDLDQQWCVSLRAIDDTMQQSMWSEPQCATWTSSPPAYLPWPAMQEPAEIGSINAFFINEGAYHGRPALLLSENLTPQLAVLPCDTQSCVEDIPDCDGSDICVDRLNESGELYDEPVIFNEFNACSYLRPQMRVKNFMVYRQGEGKDFVQVSPLVEGFSCETIRKFVIPPMGGAGYWVVTNSMRDPFIFLRDFASGAITITGSDPESGLDLTSADVDGSRLFYLDRYPLASGEKVRYKVVWFKPGDQEPRQVLTSNWLTIP